jgi:hypothetical protein
MCATRFSLLCEIAAGLLLPLWAAHILSTFLWAQATVPTTASADILRVKGRYDGQNSHELTATDIGPFLDSVVPLRLAQDDIAGAIVVVKDGKLLFAKGHSYTASPFASLIWMLGENRCR